MPVTKTIRFTTYSSHFIRKSTPRISQNFYFVKNAYFAKAPILWGPSHFVPTLPGLLFTFKYNYYSSRFATIPRI